MNRHELDLEDILTDKVVEEDIVEVPLTDRLFRVLFVISLVVVVAIFTRVVYFNVVQGDGYRAQALANMSDITIEPAPRGAVLDRTGVPLVRNEPSLNVFLIPYLLPPDPEKRDAVVERVSEFLSLDSVELRDRLALKRWGPTDKLFLANNLSQAAIVDVSAAVLPGVSVEPAFQRVPEVPFAFSHLIGYAGLVNEDDLARDGTLSVEDEIGRAGIEASYDRYLRGTDGEMVTFRDARGEPQGARPRRVAVPGNTVRTFIDAELQEFIYRRLREALIELGRTTGVAIAMDPRSGEILALVNLPSFDTTEVAEALGDPTEPLFNRGVSGLYNPGSTIKPLVALAALVEGVIDPFTALFSQGFIEVPNPYFPDQPSRFLDWKPHGWVNVRSALARSSNVYFYEVGGGFEKQRGVGIERLKQWWKRFLF
ncbi:MAG: penicillin-binding transpeptidase domain-containing protein, partial [Patescibacteria group bacterium]